MTEFNLSEKECNILVTHSEKPDFDILEGEDNVKIIIKEKDYMGFTKGYFTEDVIEFIKLLKEELNEPISMETIHEIIDKLCGDKLKSKITQGGKK